MKPLQFLLLVFTIIAGSIYSHDGANLGTLVMVLVPIAGAGIAWIVEETNK